MICCFTDEKQVFKAVKCLLKKHLTVINEKTFNSHNATMAFGKLILGMEDACVMVAPIY